MFHTPPSHRVLKKTVNWGTGIRIICIIPLFPIVFGKKSFITGQEYILFVLYPSFPSYFLKNSPLQDRDTYELYHTRFFHYVWKIPFTTRQVYVLFLSCLSCPSCSKKTVHCETCIHIIFIIPFHLIMLE